jgi:hypothetical protein
MARMARGVGLPPEGSPVTLAARVTDLTGETSENLVRALAGAEPTTDDELLALARRLEDLARSVEGDGGADPDRTTAGASLAGRPAL